ncbi:uncharacterized protein BDZ99DRAFT_462402 [Mytilinidion resinicola]|uniref:Uncharacterized protein n=1 Tax=Mytilinidion resinicola TaxID=574789 RepID=A0A6A6YQS0_9PEZI|nr:uncharacterized protein BDZ99DRAFT_462402 [Mytilinidion resinicola]KAF2811130.1 hypothetical protein BDZ99DRAFT_462402 [Mytilinidion resinicola]
MGLRYARPGTWLSPASDPDLPETSLGVGPLHLHKDLGSTISIDSDIELPRLAAALSDFAQWAFGPNGFPTLRIIAFDDFFTENDIRTPMCFFVGSPSALELASERNLECLFVDFGGMIGS